MLKRKDMVERFRDLGIKSGDHVLVHSSLHSVGPIDGGADALLDALLETVGRAGTIAAPTFSGLPEPDGYFDPLESPSNVGVFTEVLRKRPDAFRSLHPTHSVAAIGERAEAFVRDHLKAPAVGAGSPIDLIAQAGGYVMLLGVTHTANTTIHVGEDYGGMLKLGRVDNAQAFKIRLTDGTFVENMQDSSNSCSAGFNVLELPLRLGGDGPGVSAGEGSEFVDKGEGLDRLHGGASEGASGYHALYVSGVRTLPEMASACRRSLRDKLAWSFNCRKGLFRTGIRLSGI